MRAHPLWLLLCSLPALATAGGKDTVELFTDKGDTFIRAGTHQGIGAGSKVTILGEKIADTEERRTLGTAKVVEAWANLARIDLDKTLLEKPGEKLARIDRKPAVPAVPKPPPLKGRAEKAMGRIKVYNDGPSGWTDCELEQSDHSHYHMGALGPGGDEGILAFKFSKPADAPFDHLLVKCDQGQTNFDFANPHAPGGLKGYVERAGMSRVILHNESGNTWTRCDAKAPNGAHYVVGTLDAADHLRIAESDFKKEPIPDNSLLVKCRQGESRFPF